MAYSDRFIPTDSLITHLNTIAGSLPAHVQADYSGFLSVSAVTVYELAIKDIFKIFAANNNPAFGAFVAKHFNKINGRIKLENLKGDHIPSFGQSYLASFVADIATKQHAALQSNQVSITDSYDNLIVARHGYVHGGSITLTLQEVINNYTWGKEIIHTLNTVMV